MKCSTTAITALLATLAVASPAQPPVQQQGVGGILICTGANATGSCSHKVYTLQTCYDLQAPFLENTNTFALDGERFQCYPRLTACGGTCKSPTGCTFGPVDSNYKHKYNLGAIRWDKLFRSFDCILKS